MTIETAVVTLRGVTKRFRRGSEVVVAVRDASLALTPGAVTVVSGPSGSGKTTLLNLVLGWERPDEGVVEGLPSRPNWRDVSVVPQRLGLLEHVTITENVALPGRRHGLDVDVDEVLAAFGLDQLAARFPSETSLGEQQRAACARALVGSSRLILADEPSSHQDDASAAAVAEQFVSAARRGSAVLVATHDERVAAHADRRFAIRDGIVTTVR